MNFRVLLGESSSEGVELPGSEQVVRLQSTTITLGARVLTAFNLSRPDPEFDNRVWSDADFDTLSLFYPRWEGTAT